MNKFLITSLQKGYSEEDIRLIYFPQYQHISYFWHLNNKFKRLISQRDGVSLGRKVWNLSLLIFSNSEISASYHLIILEQVLLKLFPRCVILIVLLFRIQDGFLKFQSFKFVAPMKNIKLFFPFSLSLQRASTSLYNIGGGSQKSSSKKYSQPNKCL